MKTLKQSPGRIHLAFNNWRSNNKHALFGICCFFRNKKNEPYKITLGLPEITKRHTGENIAAEIIQVINTFEIRSKIGYFTLNNAKNNDTAMAIIGHQLGFDGTTRRCRCVSHIFNLSAKALLFGHNVKAFETQIYGEDAITQTQNDLWRKKGPVGKLHNFTIYINQLNNLTYMLRNLQLGNQGLTNNAYIKTKKALNVILDNTTRWLSQNYMIKRRLILRPFIDLLTIKFRSEWNKQNRTQGGTGRIKQGVKEPWILQEEAKITDHE